MLHSIFRDVDCVAHLAWEFQPTRNTRYVYEVGLRCTAVLNAAHSAGVRHLVHMSSPGTCAPGRYGEKVDETWSAARLSSSTYSRTKSPSSPCCVPAHAATPIRDRAAGTGARPC
ncbi:hypothetical protein ACX9NE_17370 [Mycobacterium sp. ML4]